MKFFRGVCILALVCTFVSCDAPRINPLDPESPDYKYFTIEGAVVAKSSKLPLDGVKVTWKNQNRDESVLTNSLGNFIINRLERSNSWIYFEKDNYWKDSSYVLFSGEKIKKQNDTLNSKPYSDYFILYTREENLLPAIKNDTLVVRASVKDAEGDLDSVMIQNKSINFFKKLTYDATNKVYQARFLSSDLGVSSLIETQGTAFELIVVNKNFRNFTVASKSLTRVITQEILINKPANGEPLSSANPIIFDWQKFEPHFDFTYTLQIYVKKIGEDSSPPIWERKLISSIDVQFSLSKQLDPGTYYWVIWAIDDFGNGTKSKPATFVIQ